jgi:hypothetical protein
MKRGCRLSLLLGLCAGAPAHAQSGGFLLVRGLAVDGSETASTGFGAIDTSGVSTEEALFLEGSRAGFEWRIRAQAAGEADRFPGKASLRINTLSYGRQISETVFLSIGKQQRLWGTGVGYQPLGFLRTQTNLRDPTDAEGRGEGIAMVHLTRLGEPLTLEAVFAEELRESRLGEPSDRQWAAKASAQLGKIDGSLLVRRRIGAPLGIGTSLTWAGDVVAVYGDLYFGPPEQRRTVSEPLANRASAAAAFHDSSGRVISSVLGFTASPAAGLSLTGEWQHRGEGLSASRWREVVSSFAEAAEAIRSPNARAGYALLARTLPLLSTSGARREYLFGRAAYTGRLLAFGLNATVGLADRSAAVTVTCGYSLAPRLAVSLAGTRFIGGPASEFGLSPVRSVISLALRRSFDL